LALLRTHPPGCPGTSKRSPFITTPFHGWTARALSAVTLGLWQHTLRPWCRCVTQGSVGARASRCVAGVAVRPQTPPNPRATSTAAARMPKPPRPRSGHIGPAARDLIDSKRVEWFSPNPKQAGTFVLNENLMPHFIKEGLASAANTVKTQRNSILRALECSGYTFEAAGVGRGHSVFSPGAKWTFPVPLVSPATRHLPSSLSSCVRCVKCQKTPEVAPAEHRQCHRGHSLCDLCFKELPPPVRSKTRGSTAEKRYWCPKTGCRHAMSRDGFRNLVVENVFAHEQVQTKCLICQDDFDGHTPIIQCHLGCCMCLPCFDEHYETWSKLKKKGPNWEEGELPAPPCLQCPGCRHTLANMTTLHTHRIKAAEYIFSQKLSI